MIQASRLLPLLLLFGCAPHDAEVTGTYTAWLAASSSANVSLGELDLEGATTFDCREIDIEERHFPCGPSEAEDNPAQLEADYFSWLKEDGYYVLRGDLAEQYRSEAIITSEGDLQLTFHIDLGNGLDFRVAWVIDPAFHPQICTQNEAGEAELVEVDDGDWIEVWSEDEDSYIFYLNAASYQLNPYDSTEEWVLPQEWLSGFSHAKFGDEEFASSASEFSYVALDSEDPDWDAYDATIEAVAEEMVAWTAELAGGPETAAATLGFDDPAFEMKMEDNKWRPLDSSSAGLDNWLQLDTSWVRIDKRGELAPGDAVRGDFQILFVGSESASNLLVDGSFDIPEIKEDRWGYEELLEEKQRENNTPTCE